MIENLIGRVLTEEITTELAVYAGEKAVFYSEAPNDKAGEWEGCQYPRVDYMVDWSYDPKRRVAGNMTVNVWCTNETEVMPEDIGTEIKEILSELFLTDESGTYSLVWVRTDAFETAGNEPQITGVTVGFDILAFPLQQSTTPDPVLSLMDYVKFLLPNAVVIGKDEMPERLRATDDCPAIFIRSSGINSAMKPSSAVGWLTVSLTGHIIAPDATARQKWLKEIADNIAVFEEFPMDDGSPMIIEGLSFNTAANPLTDGQLTVMGRYGVLRKYPDADALINIYQDYKGVE